MGIVFYHLNVLMVTLINRRIIIMDNNLKDFL